MKLLLNPNLTGLFTMTNSYKHESYCPGAVKHPFSAQVLFMKPSWTAKIRWKSLFGQVFCRSAFIGALLAIFSMPVPTWIMVGEYLFSTVQPSVNKAVANLVLATFVVTGVGALWYCTPFVFALSFQSAICTYLGMSLFLVLLGIIVLALTSSALLASEEKPQFLDISYFQENHGHLVLASTACLGLSLGYWLVRLIHA